MLSKRAFSSLSLSLLGLIAAVLPACDGRGDAPERPVPAPNVLLISLDSVRRDFLSCYGRRSPHAPEQPTTPNLDRLASEGARFTRAYSTSSWTLPSHMALMTGRPDIVHAVEMDALTLAPGHRTLAEELATAGYRTAGFYSGPYLDPRYGFDRGFERYEACFGPELTEAARRERELLEAVLEARSRDGGPPPGELTRRHKAALDELERISHRDVSSGAVSDAVLEELKAARADGRPWFVFAHYFDPHYDYVPPPPWDTRFDPRYDGDVTGKDLLTDPAVSVEQPTVEDPDHRLRTIGDRDLEHVMALYDGELAWVDHQIGRILDALRATGEIDRTIVVVTSDHGDEFFEHGNLGHRKNLFEESVRIPLIVRYPPAWSAGSEPQGVVSLSDVYPTLLALLGLPVSETAGSSSAAPLERGGPDEAGRAWLGRIVKLHPVRAAGGVRGRRVFVDEAFLQWPIKIVRARRWTDPLGELPSEVLRRVQADAERERGHDLALAWIDLEAEPGEPSQGYSRDFEDPRAKAALAAFRRVYPDLLALRATPRIGETSGAALAQLRALGYLGGDGSIEAALLDRVAIPAP